MRNALFVSIFALAAAGTALATVPDVGLDTAGTYFLRDRRYGAPGWEFPAFRAAVRELGAEFLVDHYFEIATGPDPAENRRATFDGLARLKDYLESDRLRYVFNLETANWTERADYDPPKNLFEPEPGLHYYLVPDEILAAFAQLPGGAAVCYDEIEHMQLNNSRYILKGAKGDVPALVDTTRMSLPQAYDALVQKLQTLHRHYNRHGVRVVAETVWPVMQHLFARAGWTVSPKILKESWTPVPISMALGAGIEYEKSGTDVWLNPDLWFCGHYPGHSVDELASALAVSHWLGASRIYLENLDYVNVRNPSHHPDDAKGFDYTRAIPGKHHPDADGWTGSLVRFDSGENFELSPYGKAFQAYARDYRPAHDVPYTWRDARCRIAIVRFEDSSWGQRESAFADHLLGSKIVSSDAQTEAWFGIWHRLSHGVIPPTGLSFHSRHVKYKLGPRFFVPAPPTLVFDHRIGDEHPDFDFRGAQMIFLTGKFVTDATQKLIQDRVRAGAIVATLPHLAPPPIKAAYDAANDAEMEVPDGHGRWIVAHDFLGPKVAAALAPLLGPADELQYQFGRHHLAVRAVDDARVEIRLDGELKYSPSPVPSRRARWVGTDLVPVP